MSDMFVHVCPCLSKDLGQLAHIDASERRWASSMTPLPSLDFRALLSGLVFTQGNLVEISQFILDIAN